MGVGMCSKLVANSASGRARSGIRMLDPDGRRKSVDRNKGTSLRGLRGLLETVPVCHIGLIGCHMAWRGWWQDRGEA